MMVESKTEKKPLITKAKRKNQNIYNDWTKKYSRRDGKEFASFKADFVDIILRTNLINSQLMYPLVPLDLGYIFDFDEGEELFDNSKFAIKAKEYILLTKKKISDIKNS